MKSNTNHITIQKTKCFNFDRTPFEAEIPANHYQIRWEQAKKYSKFKMSKRDPPRFKVGQVCRVAFDRTKFSRGYDHSFSNDLYQISRIKDNLPILMYKIKPISHDPNEPDVLGSFYQNELQEVGDLDYFPIDKIIKRFPKKKMALVSWQGYPDSYNSLVPLTQIKTYQELSNSS